MKTCPCCGGTGIVADDPQEPTNTFTIEFDGGTSCNIPRLGYGKGYGSYQINNDPIQRVEFGVGHSCNSAEINTVACALIQLASTADPSTMDVVVRGDSKIALKWCNPRLTAKPKDKTSGNFKIAIERLNSVKREIPISPNSMEGA